MNKLCAELRPYAPTLVGAFDIPENRLACPTLDDEARAR
ncbi:hypothetical protein JOF36_003111 [Pseudonocardia parietis]|uniref:Uncharacterized protein n=1 Tax=Pseudonocardia parietis TaxID=570936 RepID=A0ABS4VTZ4_9PSEU|nr:hypothetical protein [Pseudonocardia parietis]